MWVELGTIILIGLLVGVPIGLLWWLIKFRRLRKNAEKERNRGEGSQDSKGDGTDKTDFDGGEDKGQPNARKRVPIFYNEQLVPFGRRFAISQ